MLKAIDTPPSEATAAELFETDFTKAFVARFLAGVHKWPANSATSVARLQDLNTFTRLLLSGAQVGSISVDVDESTMNSSLFEEIVGFMADFTLESTHGWPSTAVIAVQQEPWKSKKVDFRTLRMAEASTLIGALIEASARNRTGGGDDKVKFPIKPSVVASG